MVLYLLTKPSRKVFPGTGGILRVTSFSIRMGGRFLLLGISGTAMLPGWCIHGPKSLGLGTFFVRKALIFLKLPIPRLIRGCHLPFLLLLGMGLWLGGQMRPVIPRWSRLMTRRNKRRASLARNWRRAGEKSEIENGCRGLG